MKRVLLVFMGLALLLAAPVLVGLALPREHSAWRETILAAPPEALWTVVADAAGEPDWNPRLHAARRLPDRDGRPTWQYRFGEPGQRRMATLTLETVESVPPVRLVRRIGDSAAPFAGTWAIELEPAAGGTRLRVNERGRIENPFVRAVARVSGLRRGVDGYLRALAARFGEPDPVIVTPTAP